MHRKLAAAVLVLSSLLFTETASAARYIVVLREHQSGEPDVAALGGHILASRMNRRLVDIPETAAPELSKHPGVAYVQRLWDSSAPELQMSSQAVSTRVTTYSDTPDWTTGAYSYDSSGNIKSLGADTYAYDSSTRLIRSTVDNGTDNYQYDAYGNLWNSKTGAIDDKNQVATRDYDGAGYVSANEAGRPYRYDATGMLTSIPAIEGSRRMIYTADDERIATVTNSGIADETWKIRVRNQRNQIAREFLRTEVGTEWVRDYVYADGRLVGGERQVANGQIGGRHYHLDHLGSTRLITRSGDAARITQPKFAPFGAEVRSSRDEANLGHTPIEPLKFTGHERDYVGAENVDDGELLDYMHARYYDVQLARFLSVDPTWESADVGKPQSWNRYAYVLNNPANALDPDGRVDIEVGMPTKKTLEKWGPEERAEWNAKWEAEAAAAEEGTAEIRSPDDKRRPGFRRELEKITGELPPDKHADHIRSFILNGPDDALTNGQALSGSVNTSAGSLLKRAIKGLAPGTKITSIKFPKLSIGALGVALALLQQDPAQAMVSDVTWGGPALNENDQPGAELHPDIIAATIYGPPAPKRTGATGGW